MGKNKGRVERGRFTTRKKTEAVLRLLRGEELDALSRELSVTAATLSEWREDFLAAGQAGLKSRAPSIQDEELQRLKAMVGDLTMRLEIHKAAEWVRANRDPLRPRRSKP